MRVPTYSNYTNMSNAIKQNRELVDKYSFQAGTGLKHQNYSGYGMSAYNIVSMESTLTITNTFMENNKLANIELETSNLAIETITNSLADVKSVLTELYGTDLTNISPDYTGGEISFTSGNHNDYMGKTITVNGTTYTFADNNDGNNIKIDNLSTPQNIMKALVDKVGNGDFVYDEYAEKITFPLYTIDGVSTVLTEEPAKSAVKTGEPHMMDAEQSLAVKNAQNLAFSTMQLLADTLNTYVNGKYLYGGGASAQPVNFNYSSLEEFQSYYNGVTTLYPSSGAATLSDFSVDISNTGDVTFALDAGETNKGTITATNGSFLKQSLIMNEANVGSLKFDGINNSMKATEYGAFTSLKPGDTIVLTGTNADMGNNQKNLVVKSVSADGRTVTFVDEPRVETTDVFNPQGDVVINKTFAVGSVINLEGFGNKNLAPTATVTGISPDGKELYVMVDGDRFPSISSAGNTKWAISAETYYKGGDLEYNQRISESQTIGFDVKASDPAFEKIFRALGQIAQGNIVDTSNPMLSGSIDTEKTLRLVEEALDLITDATSGTGDISLTKNSSLYSISAKLNADYTTLNKVTENQTLAVANLEANIDSVKSVDKDEAAVKLLLAESALEASYSILSSVSQLSLLNYMK